MTVSLDRYLSWRFDYQKRNCWHLTRAVWLDLTGRDIGDRTPQRLSRAALIGRFETDVPQFTLLDGPADPSIVLMQRKGDVPHVGVYVRGRVLQIKENGVTFEPVPDATRGWDSVGFYR